MIESHRTTGFERRAGVGTTFTWPLWRSSVSPDVCRSLLSLPDLQRPTPPRPALAARGVVEVLRCRRVTVGKFRSFTPAEPV